MRSAIVEISVRGRMPAGVATAVVVVVLAVVNVAEHVLRGALWVGPVVVVALVCFARWTGLSWSQLGLSKDQLRSGCRWGLGAIAVVATAYLAGVLSPLTRSAFLDARYHLAVSGALLSAFVIIPVGTILVEEVAFRSVLWGMLARQFTSWRVLVASSVLFGLWHILPSLHLTSANQGVGLLLSRWSQQKVSKYRFDPLVSVVGGGGYSGSALREGNLPAYEAHFEVMKLGDPSVAKVCPRRNRPRGHWGDSLQLANS